MDPTLRMFLIYTAFGSALLAYGLFGLRMQNSATTERQNAAGRLIWTFGLPAGAVTLILSVLWFMNYLRA